MAPLHGGSRYPPRSLTPPPPPPPPQLRVVQRQVLHEARKPADAAGHLPERACGDTARGGICRRRHGRPGLGGPQLPGGLFPAPLVLRGLPRDAPGGGRRDPHQNGPRHGHRLPGRRLPGRRRSVSQNADREAPPAARRRLRLLQPLGAAPGGDGRGGAGAGQPLRLRRLQQQRARRRGRVCARSAAHARAAAPSGADAAPARSPPRSVGRPPARRVARRDAATIPHAAYPAGDGAGAQGTAGRAVVPAAARVFLHQRTGASAASPSVHCAAQR